VILLKDINRQYLLKTKIKKNEYVFSDEVQYLNHGYDELDKSAGKLLREIDIDDDKIAGLDISAKEKKYLFDYMKNNYSPFKIGGINNNLKKKNFILI